MFTVNKLDDRFTFALLGVDSFTTMVRSTFLLIHNDQLRLLVLLRHDAKASLISTLVSLTLEARSLRLTRGQSHFHAESENAPFVSSLRADLNRASIDLHKVLADSQAHSNPFTVDLCCPLELSEKLEEILDVFGQNTLAVVDDTDFDHLFCVIKAGHYPDHPTHGELQRILHQVDQDLL